MGLTLKLLRFYYFCILLLRITYLPHLTIQIIEVSYIFKDVSNYFFKMLTYMIIWPLSWAKFFTVTFSICYINFGENF